MSINKKPLLAQEPIELGIKDAVRKRLTDGKSKIIKLLINVMWVVG